MQKIPQVPQIREADAYTIANEPVASIDLMERAAQACFKYIKARWKKPVSIKIFCGMGNNGGDGLAIGRMLALAGFDVSVYKVLHMEQASDDFLENEKRLSKIKRAKYFSIAKMEDFPEIESNALLIDALLGSGLNRKAEGLIADLIVHLNRSAARIVSIDMPSGLYADKPLDDLAKATVIEADITLSFQFPKLAFFFPENEPYTGVWEILDIGLLRDYTEQMPVKEWMLESADVTLLYRPRKRFSHKGHYGHVLLLAGSYGKAGAAILASKACIGSGAGLVSVCTPAQCVTPLQTAVPEAMIVPVSQENYLDVCPDLDKYNVVAAGPGLGTQRETSACLKILIQNSRSPLVLDADALNILAENPTWLAFLPPNSILTPHPGEFSRLAGKAANSFERLEQARNMAVRFGIFILLKDAISALLCPDGNCYFNSSGNPGMATGGSGDVLTGIIAGLMAQGYTSKQSALMGMYLHGMAGDLAARRKGFECLKAGDIIDFLPKAFRYLFY